MKVGVGMDRRARRLVLQRPRVLLAVALIAACAPDGSTNRVPAAPIDAPLVVEGVILDPARVNRHLASRIGFTSRGGQMRCAYVPLGSAVPASDSLRGRARIVRLPLSTLCLELVREGDSLAAGSGRGGPVAVTVIAEGDSLRLTDVDVPPDGGGHAAGIRRIFPPEIADRILVRTAGQHNAESGALEAQLREEAATRLGVIDRRRSRP